MIEITIPMRPVAKARPRVNKSGHTWTPKKTKDAENAIAAVVGCLCKQPLEGPVAVKIEFTLTPPKSWSKKKKAEAHKGLILPVVRPDLDNFEKLVLDSINGIAFNDDSQVVKLESSKRYGEEDKIYILIMEV